MKKKIISFMCISFISIIILFLLVKIIDFHTDGTSVRNGDYYIETISRNYRLDIYNGSIVEGARTWFYYVGKGAQKRFTFEYQGEGEYIIRSLDSMCIGVADDKINISQQVYRNSEEQRWYITRVNGTHYFKIINVGTGKALRYVDQDGYNCSCDDENAEDNNYNCFLIY